MGALTNVWAWRLAGACRLELTRIGGTPLAEDAETEARWYAQLHHPWDGRGVEPDARINGWLSVLLARTELARRRHRAAGPDPGTGSGTGSGTGTGTDQIGHFLAG